jgi:N-methylhydantoinase A
VARLTSSFEADELSAILTEQREDGEARLRANDVLLKEAVTAHYAEMAYVGQIHTLRVPIEFGWDARQINAAFQEAYRREYGNTLGEIPTTIVSFRSVVQGVREHVRRALETPVTAPPPPPIATRQVHFNGWRNTPIYDRNHLQPGMEIPGPAIVEQADTTTVIEPDMQARVDAYGNILVEIG